MIKDFEKGQSLFEVVVAVAMSALIVTAVVSVAVNSIQNSSFSRNKTLAASYVEDTNEWLRKERDASLSTFTTHVSTQYWCFKTLAWSTSGKCGSTAYISDTHFLRQTTFTVTTLGSTGKNVVQIDTTVSWQDSKGLHDITGSSELSI